MADQHHRFVGSSRVEEAWYSVSKKRVRVRFPDGVYWSYRGVPSHVWQEFRDAGSAGKFLNEVLTVSYENGPG